jgi:thiol-disulfide isomerase/thioredoxin
MNALVHRPLLLTLLCILVGIAGLTPAIATAEAASAEAEPLFNSQLGQRKIGDTLPDLDLRVEDQEAKLSDFRGRPMILALVFGAIPPDVYVPRLNALAEKFGPYGLKVAALLVSANVETYDQWLVGKAVGLRFSRAWDPAGAFVRTETKADAMAHAQWDSIRAVRRIMGAGTMGGPMMPAYLVIDADGRFGGWLVGHADFDDGIANLLLHAGLRLESKDMPKRLAPEGDFIVEALPLPALLLGKGAKAPDFVATDLDGKAVKPSDHLGQVVILDFWATWCGPCLASFPHTQMLASTYKNQGLVVLGSCTNDARGKFESWVRENQAKYPDIRFSYDSAGRANNRASAALYGVNGIPTQFIIGRDGVIVDVVVGYEPDSKKLETALAKAGVNVGSVLIGKGAADL